MINAERVVSCDKCGSFNFETEEHFCNQHFVVDSAGDFHVSLVADRKRIYHCKNCGYTFGEKAAIKWASFPIFEFDD